MLPDMHGPWEVKDPERDGRVPDADRFTDERRREALAMIQLWRRSKKPWAGDEQRYWRGVLRDIDRKAGVKATDE